MPLGEYSTMSLHKHGDRLLPAARIAAGSAVELVFFRILAYLPKHRFDLGFGKARPLIFQGGEFLVGGDFLRRIKEILLPGEFG